MLNNVNSIPVLVYGNIVGWFPAGITLNIDCSARKVKTTDVNTTVGGACLRLEPGGNWPNGAPDGFTTTNMVQLNTDEGYVWIKTADYTAFIAACNSCCVG